jgi:hypothetical protein
VRREREMTFRQDRSDMRQGLDIVTGQENRTDSRQDKEKGKGERTL